MSLDWELLSVLEYVSKSGVLYRHFLKQRNREADLSRILYYAEVDEHTRQATSDVSDLGTSVGGGAVWVVGTPHLSVRRPT